MSSKRNKIAIALFVAAVVMQVVACLIWLVPVSGLLLYPMISGCALVLSIISSVLANEKKVLRVISIIFSVVLVIMLIAHISSMVSLVLEML